jgi:TolB-like protein/Tfp pilus assembly protein PilF
MIEKILHELRERKVIQKMTIYLGSWWVSIEVVDFLTNRFELDLMWVKSLTILGAVLIPSALIWSWFGFAFGWWRKQLIFYVINILGVALFFYSSDLTSRKADVQAATTKNNKSIAVLAFTNLSGDRSKEYFSDGLAEEMIGLLSKIGPLKVIGRQSSFQFKNKNEDLRAIGKKLGVATLLDGTVRQTSNEVRVSVSLINAMDGSTLWSDTYDRKIEEVLKIQDEIALVVVSKLKIAMLEGLAKSPNVNKEAFDLYLKGKESWNERKLKESEDYFKRAIEIDSLFAPAYSGLAEAYMLFPHFNAGIPLETYPKAQAAAKKAIQIDNSLSVPFLVLAMKNLHFDLNLDSARFLFLEAIKKNPDYSANHYLFGHYLTQTSNNQESILETQKSIELEPLSAVTHQNMGRALLISKKYSDALKYLKHSLELNKAFSNSYLHMGHCYNALGQLNEAEKAYKKSAELMNDRAKACLINFYLINGAPQKARDYYKDLIEQSKKVYVSKIVLAWAASFMKDKELAHELVKKAFDDHDSWLGVNLEYTTKQPNDIFSDPRNVELYKKFLPSILVNEGVTK